MIEKPYEQISVGDRNVTRGRTITEADNTWFTLLTMNQHPSHFDVEFAKKTEFKRPLVASPLTVAIMTGQSVSDVSQKAVANLGWKEIRMTKPVFVGDTLYSESEVLEKRESSSRPDQGIVTIATRARNQHGESVCECTRVMLIWKKGFGPMED